MMGREPNKISKERYVRPAHSSRRRHILKRINRKDKIETENEKMKKKHPNLTSEKET
jgi:hypothetical protein